MKDVVVVFVKLTIESRYNGLFGHNNWPVSIRVFVRQTSLEEVVRGGNFLIQLKI
jgi:hypothetical protein